MTYDINQLILQTETEKDEFPLTILVGDFEEKMVGKLNSFSTDFSLSFLDIGDDYTLKNKILCETLYWRTLNTGTLNIVANQTTFVLPNSYSYKYEDYEKSVYLIFTDSNNKIVYSFEVEKYSIDNLNYVYELTLDGQNPSITNGKYYIITLTKDVKEQEYINKNIVLNLSNIFKLDNFQSIVSLNYTLNKSYNKIKKITNDNFSLTNYFINQLNTQNTIYIHVPENSVNFEEIYLLLKTAEGPGCIVLLNNDANLKNKLLKVLDDEYKFLLLSTEISLTRVVTDFNG